MSAEITTEQCVQWLYAQILVAESPEAKAILARLRSQPQAGLTDADKLLREVDEYLSSNSQNSIWSGSKLHRSIKTAFAAKSKGAS